ncbi:hypothetical protein [Komagataeibacter diospyri]|uniref:Uncharacterized protein n=1 Tax=Komagataeibacter diospyri TaxID=1932662 RepID=A0A4P5NU42_9PROT|nr:hypothetical protein [Komagataeibacter diospyri]GCE85159.1 hypothetical protein MSKU9_3300 [Komagataeibacter diospyri]
MTDTPQNAAPATPTPPSVAYVVTIPGHGYPMGTQITDAATIAKLKAAGTLDRFTVRVALTQEK